MTRTVQHPPWLCTRQQAGPLVKESRAIRPRLSKDDSFFDRAEKNKILRPMRDSSFRRTMKDRAELYLALFGQDGVTYVLTFDDCFLPPDYKSVRKLWKRFLAALKRRKKTSVDYFYFIEGKHGDHRYHIHVVLRRSDFTAEEVQFCWGGGHVYYDPLIKDKKDTYRRTAEYACKEPSDGITIPFGRRHWVASKSLRGKLPPLERFRSSSGNIPVPANIRIATDAENKENAFGQYNIRSYILV